MGFLSLIFKVASIALTPEEQERVAMLRAAGGIILSSSADVEPATRGVLTKPTALPDVKRPCSTCKQPRSFTLLTNTGQCGKCVSAAPGTAGAVVVKEPLRDKSYFCDCSACGARYAVVNVEGLRVRPKCHYCREASAKGAAKEAAKADKKSTGTGTGKKKARGEIKAVAATNVPTLCCAKCGVNYVFPRKSKATGLPGMSKPSPAAIGGPVGAAGTASSPSAFSACASAAVGIASTSPSAASASASAATGGDANSAAASPAAGAGLGAGTFPSPAAGTGYMKAGGASASASGATAGVLPFSEWQCPGCIAGSVPSDCVTKITLKALVEEGEGENAEIVLASLGLARAPGAVRGGRGGSLADAAPATVKPASYSSASVVPVAVHPGTVDVFEAHSLFTTRHALRIADHAALGRLIPGVLGAAHAPTASSCHAGCCSTSGTGSATGGGAAGGAGDASCCATGGSCSASSGPLGLRFRSLPVINSEEVLATIAEHVSAGKAALGTCGLCWEDLPKDKLRSCCLRKGCDAIACDECLRGWYTACQPGGLFTPANAQCPFCKRQPSAKVLNRFNPRLCALVSSRPGGVVTALDANWYYGWCVGCYEAKEYMQKACADTGAPPELRDFTCADCVERAALIEVARLEAEAARGGAAAGGRGSKLIVATFMRPCPGCTAMVLKAGGCDHITCNCGTHWCWRCGKVFPYNVIYQHLASCNVTTDSSKNAATAVTVWTAEDDDFFDDGDDYDY